MHLLYLTYGFNVVPFGLKDQLEITILGLEENQLGFLFFILTVYNKRGRWVDCEKTAI